MRLDLPISQRFVGRFSSPLPSDSAPISLVGRSQKFRCLKKHSNPYKPPAVGIRITLGVLQEKQLKKISPSFWELLDQLYDPLRFAYAQTNWIWSGTTFGVVCSAESRKKQCNSTVSILEFWCTVILRPCWVISPILVPSKVFVLCGRFLLDARMITFVLWVLSNRRGESCWVKYGFAVSSRWAEFLKLSQKYASSLYTLPLRPRRWFFSHLTLALVEAKGYDLYQAHISLWFIKGLYSQEACVSKAFWWYCAASTELNTHATL